MNLRLLALASLVPLAAALPVSAQIIGTSGAITLISPPASVLPGVLEGPDIAVFYEGTFVLPASLTIQTASNPFATTTLAAGTQVQSYFFHFDPVGDPANAAAGGNVQFQNAIFGLIPTDAGLNATDYFAASLYPTGTSFRGLEFPDFAISLNSLDLAAATFATGNQIDQFRVLTAILEPSTYALAMGVIVLGIVGLRRVRGRSAGASVL